MFDQIMLTPGMQEVVNFSKTEATRLGHNSAGPEHYLLGLIGKADGITVGTLRRMNVELNELQQTVERIIIEIPPEVGLLHSTTDELQVMAATKDIAVSMKHNAIGTEHLLLALVQGEDTIAGQCLRRYDLNYDNTRQVVQDVINSIQAHSVYDQAPFTPDMREVIRLSKAEAGRLGHNYIGPEHYLLGIIRKDGGLAAQTLHNMKIDLDGIKAELEQAVGTGNSGTCLFTPNADGKRIIASAREIANELKHNCLGSEHLLLALVREENPIAGRCLRQFNLNYENTRREVLKVVEGM